MRAFALVFFCLISSGVFAGCSPDKVELRGLWGQASFQVEVADTPQLRNTGLMNRKNMASSAGMLFVFDHPQQVAFWMKNTLIPLDMVFVDEAGRVKRVHQNAIPHDETSIPGGDGIQFVLEINGGMAALFGISEGSEIRHPAIGAETALWQC